ncbi:hypothetical protein [Pelagicoccus mobilis]|uniref:Copper resistance protein CopD n=1 Tax=Pelagicoccus mobilis TaxID=415221 RepID=A0A934VSA9_9BACT|nr:hypothetical protein [Pelagicoccus mobilis]MBK1880252.1 hypothetical protein [Pelagicoccus mobilis]
MNIYGVLVVLHLLGACVWLGGHAVLAYLLFPSVLNDRNPDVMYRIETAYDRIGMPALFVQVATGLMLAYGHVPDFGSWLAFEVPMARMIVMKLALLLLILGLSFDLRIRMFAKVGSAGLKSLGWHTALVLLLSATSVFLGASFRIGWLY